MIDLSAPIIPYEWLWWIRLYMHISDLQDVIMGYKDWQPTNNWFESSTQDYKIVFEKKWFISLVFNIMNWKLYAMTAHEYYTWKLFWDIHVGMHIDEVLKLEPSFVYEDFEEFYISDKGILIETDVMTDCVSFISISVKECKGNRTIGDSFDRGEW